MNVKFKKSEAISLDKEILHTAKNELMIYMNTVGEKLSCTVSTIVNLQEDYPMLIGYSVRADSPSSDLRYNPTFIFSKYFDFISCDKDLISAYDYDEHRDFKVEDDSRFIHAKNLLQSFLAHGLELPEDDLTEIDEDETMIDVVNLITEIDYLLYNCLLDELAPRGKKYTISNELVDFLNS